MGRLRNKVMSWFSKKQQVVALLTTKEKYIVAACQAVWLRRVLKDLKYFQVDPMTICCD